MGWEQHVASFRLGDALVASGAPGIEAAELLREVHQYATEQGAAPLAEEVEALAAIARVSLSSPSLPAAPAVPAAFSGLTAREFEVLAHLVASRTNAEIARALFISEKTVSVHVSDLAAQDRHRVAPGSRRSGPSPGLGSRRIKIPERSSVWFPGRQG